jgi:RNA polymerase sigma-70 factor (ECF subfamily)
VLRDELVRHLDERLRSRVAASPALEDALAEAVGTARAAWPDFDVPDGVFLCELAERLPAEGEPTEALRALCVSDLYLACACASGDERAIAALERQHFGEVDAALGQLRCGPALIDEVKQLLRQKLLVAAEGRAPAIRGYSGRGKLRRWLRVVAVRTARRLRRAEGRDVALDDHLAAALPSPGADPELEYAKRLYQDAFQEAFAEAMGSLSEEDRLLLKQHFVDGLNIDHLAALHGVHRATAARWLAGVREQIASRTRTALARRTQAGGRDYESILRLVHSRIEISIRGFLIPR